MSVDSLNNILFSSLNKNTSQHTATISIDNRFVRALYDKSLLIQKDRTQTYGFSQGETPLHYIEYNFKPILLEHLKEVLFNHYILNSLCQSFVKNKIVAIGNTILKEVYLTPEEDGKFVYSYTRAQLKQLHKEKWYKLNLRAPERKNYKDLDRQVESFIEEEALYAEKELYSEIIQLGDWIGFEVSFADAEKQLIFDDYKNLLWIRLSKEEVDFDLQDMFLGKRVGDTFMASNAFLQDFISSKLNLDYRFIIKIKYCVSNSYFSFKLFKQHFQLKSNREIHRKLIEVFSFRNDISQRRETVEAAFRLLFKSYFVQLPKSLIDRQKHFVLDAVQNNPDYNVYKSQKDFYANVQLLAEKQLKEAILADTIAYEENIKVTDTDVCSYVNLITRPRTKEFIYFDIPFSYVRTKEVAIPHELLKQYCLREKTINYVIFKLTKKASKN